MGLLERGISRLEKKILPPSETPVVIIHFVETSDGDQPPNRWWVENDGKVVEFATIGRASKLPEYSMASASLYTFKNPLRVIADVTDPDHSGASQTTRATYRPSPGQPITTNPGSV